MKRPLPERITLITKAEISKEGGGNLLIVLPLRFVTAVKIGHYLSHKNQV